VLAAAPAVSIGAAAAAAPAATTTTTTTTTSTVPTPTTTGAPATSAPTPTTNVADLLAGVNWIQATYASPCTDSEVRLVGGSAVHGGARAVLDDIVALDARAGLALAFLSCRGPGDTMSQTTVSLVRARRGGVETVAERDLGAAARVVAIEAPTLVVEAPATAPADGACCADVINRQTLRVTADGFAVTSEEQVSAFEQTVAAAPVVGDDAELVRRSVTPVALCFRWDNVWLSAEADPAEPAAPAEPSAELQALRLALVHVTGRWIDPTDRMNAEMAAVVAAYQEARGLAVDGTIGNETTDALAADLGCSSGGGFTMVPPRGLGPRNFRSVAQLVSAAERFASSGRSGYASIDQLLTDARWDGRNAMFLGCYRWQAPASGLSCSWSGATPLQLVGLVDDPATPGLGTFSILYARSTAV
jgi:hypothetical protein